MKTVLLIYETAEPPCELMGALTQAGFRVITTNANPNTSVAENLHLVERAMQHIPADAVLGVIGIGYGGAIAGHLLSLSDCFCAAVLISALTNPSTAYGTGSGIIFPGISEKFCMLDYLTKLAEESVVARCDAISTPVLLLHGFKDQVYGFEQAEQFFTAVKERHPTKDLRMVVFPSGEHDLLESSCAARCEREILDWFSAKMDGGDECAPEASPV